MDQTFKSFTMNRMKLFLFSGHDTTSNLTAADPYLLNQLPYTVAVIREVLRMYPAVSGTRIGERGFDVVVNTGRHFPTQTFLVWDIGQAIQRDPAYWLRPDDFLPERWLVSPGDAFYPIKGAYRPFSHGPRNCIGQELAMMEMKVIMVLVARRFEITLGYEILDRAKQSKGITTVYGERGYQV
ncbi:MAG: hypothetical protein Q9226_002697 [Calogaya cf. arnoldii]